jgi:tagaturonate epimerase
MRRGMNLKIEKYTFGIGDRFSHQGRAQLRAMFKAREAGIDVSPVWSKSNREHLMIKSKPDDVRTEAEAAVTALGWKGAYHVDADHVGLKTVDSFIPASDFFTWMWRISLGKRPKGVRVKLS